MDVNTFLLIDVNSSVNIFANNVLIMPAISVGNVGQLACDLLISTLKLKKVAYFGPEFFLPMVGNNPFTTSSDDNTVLSINSEVYHNSQKQVAVLQLRSPIIKKKQALFQKALVEWIKKCCFNEVIVLSSCHSYERADAQLVGTPFRYLVTPQASKFEEKFQSLNWKRLEERDIGHGDRTLFLPGGGFTKSMFQDFCFKEVVGIVLLVFCAEGDNIPEANILASRLNQWKQYLANAEKWKPPSSWVHLFGNQPPKEIF